MQLVCHLCRCRFESPDVEGDVRCPRCDGKIRPDVVRHARAQAGAVAAAPPAEDGRSATVGCPQCLRVLPVRGDGPYTCRYCGTYIHPQEGGRLAEVLAGLESRVKTDLLGGRSPVELISEITALGVLEERSHAFLDGRVSELPFDRHERWKGGAQVKPAACCDACGLAAGLSPWDVEWTVREDEMQRYRSGWGGFEGGFAKAGHYTRQALYYLCDRCRREMKRPEFAGGYPAKFGFRVRRSGRVKNL